MNEQSPLASIDEVLSDLRCGKPCIIVDDQRRENEGDLVVAAEKITAKTVNFMARYGRGLICLALTPQRVEDLRLSLMSTVNESRHQTAFTTSIEARDGIATGISAADRSKTIKTAINPAKGPGDIVSPGHVFPLIARTGGVLERAGHTEAAVDLARAADLNPAGVICEIMNDDGTMARLDDLRGFAKTHGLNIASIADLITWRLRQEKFVEARQRQTFISRYGGDFQLTLYINRLQYAEHVALTKGKIDPSQPVLVRMHSLNILNDVLGQRTSQDHDDLHRAMTIIGNKGHGVIVLIREPRPTTLSEHISQSTPDTSFLREYGIGAQILHDLGVRNMILLSDRPRTISALDGYGLRVVGHHQLH